MFWICGLFLARDMYCASRPPNSCVFKYLLPKELLWMLFIIKVLNKVICLFLGQHWASVWWMHHEMGCPVSNCNFYTRQSFILAINPSRAAVLRVMRVHDVQGRKARLKSNTITSAHQRRGRTTSVSSMANSTPAYNRTSRPARSFASIPEDSQRSLVDFNGTTSEGSPEDEKVTLLAEVWTLDCSRYQGVSVSSCAFRDRIAITFQRLLHAPLLDSTNYYWILLELDGFYKMNWHVAIVKELWVILL